MLSLSTVTASLAVLATVQGAKTRVSKDNGGPTGYKVTFVFKPNASQTFDNVLWGGMPLYSNPLGGSASKTMGIPPSQWKPDCFSMGLFSDYTTATYSGYNMTHNAKSGEWTLTLPFPSGTFNYAFYPNCKGPWGPSTTCKAYVDPSNPPIQRVPGNQLVSTIQVPFDSRYQVNNYDWQLPLAVAADRGNISFHQYPLVTYGNYLSAVGIYLPKEYGTVPGKQYPTLYLHHGGGGTDSDWFNQGRAHNIFDRMISQGLIEPTVIVTPNFYAMPFSLAQFATNTTVEGFDTAGLNAFFNTVRTVYQNSLIPWIEANYDVAPRPARRAFAGLSLGGGMTLSMLFNATTSFSSFCVMSNTPAPPLGDPQYQNSTLQDVGLFFGAGFYDLAFTNSRNAQARFDAAGLGSYLSQYPLNGAHQWSTWQEILYYYARYGLWQNVPFSINPKQGPFDLSGGVPY